MRRAHLFKDNGQGQDQATRFLTQQSLSMSGAEKPPKFKFAEGIHREGGFSNRSIPYDSNNFDNFFGRREGAVLPRTDHLRGETAALPGDQRQAGQVFHTLRRLEQKVRTAYTTLLAGGGAQAQYAKQILVFLRTAGTNGCRRIAS